MKKRFPHPHSERLHTFEVWGPANHWYSRGFDGPEDWEKRAARRIAQDMEATGHSDLVGRAHSIASCPQIIKLDYGNGLRTTLVQRCQQRLCPICGRLRNSRHADRLSGALRWMQQPVLVTVGLGTQGTTDIPETVRKVKSTFTRLRRRARWVKAVEGGLGTMEIKWFPAPRRFWVHLHLLVDPHLQGEDIEAWSQWIQCEWAELTGSSRGGQAVQVEHGDHARVARYLAKLFDGRLPWPGTLRGNDLVAYAKGVARLRTFLTYGRFHRRNKVGSNAIALATIADSKGPHPAIGSSAPVCIAPAGVEKQTGVDAHSALSNQEDKP
ncbi:MAG: protein rep [Myxococcales bacterium]|nr:protein rep [Myxococcales bacterium]